MARLAGDRRSRVAIVIAIFGCSRSCHRPDDDLDRRVHADLHGRRVARGTSSAATRATSRSATPCSSGPARYARRARRPGLARRRRLGRVRAAAGRPASSPALVAIPVGLIALRTRRHTFVVSRSRSSSSSSWPPTTSASPAAPPGLHAARAAVVGRDLQRPVLLRRRWSILVVDRRSLSWAVRRSRFGLQLLAIRDDEDRARGLGVHDRAREAHRVRDLGDPGRDGRRPLRLLPRPDLPAVRLRPAVRPLDRADGASSAGSGRSPARCSARSCSSRCSSTSRRRSRTQRPYLIIYGVLFLAVILLLPRGVIPSARGAGADAPRAARPSRAREEREATPARRRRRGGAR